MSPRSESLCQWLDAGHLWMWGTMLWAERYVLYRPSSLHHLHVRPGHLAARRMEGCIAFGVSAVAGNRGPCQQEMKEIRGVEGCVLLDRQTTLKCSIACSVLFRDKFQTSHQQNTKDESGGANSRWTAGEWSRNLSTCTGSLLPWSACIWCT